MNIEGDCGLVHLNVNLYVCSSGVTLCMIYELVQNITPIKATLINTPFYYRTH